MKTQINYLKLKGGVPMDEHQVKETLKIIREYDRMPNNPDNSELEKSVRWQLENRGILTFSIFVCPKFNTEAVNSRSPEKYMPTKATDRDLFEPRMAKIDDLRNKLSKIGVYMKVFVLIGDNDGEIYIFPFMKNFEYNAKFFSERRKAYENSFKERLRFKLGRFEVYSLGEMGIDGFSVRPDVPKIELNAEISFLKKLFSKEGPYKGRLKFTDSELKQMVEYKFGLYGEQGKFLEEQIGGILLQTESPGLWLQRTKMFRCAGSPAIPVIYPWIRREEQVQLKRKE